MKKLRLSVAMLTLYQWLDSSRVLRDAHEVT
jgi:hypothetical protein